MLDIPEKAMFIFLLVINILFSATGLIMIVQGIYKLVTQTEMSEELNDSFHSGGSAIFLGIVNLAVGVLGLAGVWFKKRILLIVYSGVVAAIVISSIFFLIVFTKAIIDVNNVTTDRYRKMIIADYGNSSSSKAKLLTENIDNFQNREHCCGWSQDLDQNIYMKTPWHKESNVVNGSVPSVRNLPDSCCKKAGPVCRETTNMKEARDKEIIYPYDCMDVFVSYVKGPLWIFAVQSMFVTVLQILAGTATALNLLKPGATE